MPTMNPISATELAHLQADAAALLDLSCVVKSKTRTTDAQGGASETYATVTTCLAGMAQPTASQFANYNYLIGSLAAWQVKLPVGTNVQEENQLVIAGETLKVVKVLTPRSYPVLLTVLAVEVK